MSILYKVFDFTPTKNDVINQTLNLDKKTLKSLYVKVSEGENPEGIPPICIDVKEREVKLTDADEILNIMDELLDAKDFEPTRRDLIMEMNQIAVDTRRGSANLIIGNPQTFDKFTRGEWTEIMSLVGSTKLRLFEVPSAPANVIFMGYEPEKPPAGLSDRSIFSSNTGIFYTEEGIQTNWRKLVPINE